jgi:hypothetical protein
LQSFPTAYAQYYNEENPKKRICFYFLKPDGNIETPYLMFNYQIMATLGVEFLNSKEVLQQTIIPFGSVDDIIENKNSLKQQNASNNSSYITKDSANITEIYAKTYGASKYESALLAFAASTLVNKVKLYEIVEGNLTSLPKSWREILKSNKKIEIISTDKTQDKNLVYPSALRRPSYIFELHQKFGAKKCAFCEIDNPSEIEGAHIWPVAAIKLTNLSEDKQTEAAIDGDNGLWLCGGSTSSPDHHQMFDSHDIRISENGELKIRSSFKNQMQILTSFNIDRIEPWILTPKFLEYLEERKKLQPPETDYVSIADIR